MRPPFGELDRYISSALVADRAEPPLDRREPDAESVGELAFRRLEQNLAVVALEPSCAPLARLVEDPHQSSQQIAFGLVYVRNSRNNRLKRRQFECELPLLNHAIAFASGVVVGVVSGSAGTAAAAAAASWIWIQISSR